MSSVKFDYDVCVVGGFGHVGLPLSIAFANIGKKTCAYDIDEAALNKLEHGIMPFMEFNGDKLFSDALKSGNLHFSQSKEVVGRSKNIIITIGTPTDEHLNPEFHKFKRLIDQFINLLNDEQLILIRSTVYPGTTEMIGRYLVSKGKNTMVAFCPERIIEGYALKELFELPQIVSATTKEGIERAKELFTPFKVELIEALPLEAELAKLFTNAWRYIKFGVANQFYMIANDAGVDFYNVYRAMTHGYHRAADLPRAGFAAGPCLFKDTVQANAFHRNNFYIGNATLQVNEGLPSYIVERLKLKFDLKVRKVGILGMAFKPEIDDLRDSLSYKLKKILELETTKVLCSDEYIKDKMFVEPEKLVEDSDIIIVATPHKKYLQLTIPTEKFVVDIWNFYGKGSKI